MDSVYLKMNVYQNFVISVLNGGHEYYLLFAVSIIAYLIYWYKTQKKSKRDYFYNFSF